MTLAPALDGHDGPDGTHSVFNTPQVYGGYNLWSHDAALQEAVAREGADWAAPELDAFGHDLAADSILRDGHLANRHLPELRSHDDFGHRINEVQVHPSWHNLMALARRHRVHSGPWLNGRPGAHVARAAKSLLMAQVESGVLCPVHMTYSGIPVLRKNLALSAVWEPRLVSTDHDPSFAPAEVKSSAMIGMAMTEKQGGSDLRANTTVARPTSEPGVFDLTGHKWFFSAPMVDCFLTVGHIEGQPGRISCFFVPFFLPDGSRNRFSLIRLKDKLGNRSNPSSEIEFNGTRAWLVGQEGRGVSTIIEMVNLTRLGRAAISAGIIRQTTFRALHHTHQRAAFGAKLVDKPLMRNVLADLALESEAATSLCMRLAGAVDRMAENESERRLARVLTAVTKYWLAKRASPTAFEALECLGGYGYVEESMMPRFYREAPVQSIWEGSGNVICLDVLRALDKDPTALDPLFAEIDAARGACADLDRLADALRAMAGRRETLEPMARRLVEGLALAMQASLLIRHAPDWVAGAFCASRLGGQWGHAFGTLDDGPHLQRIIRRSYAQAA